MIAVNNETFAATFAALLFLHVHFETLFFTCLKTEKRTLAKTTVFKKEMESTMLITCFSKALLLMQL